MKKTLFAILALLSLLPQVKAATPTTNFEDSLTFATTNAYDGSKYATVSGFVVNLQPTSVRYTATDVTQSSRVLTSDDILGNQFIVSAITFNPRATRNNVFLYVVDMTDQTIAGISSVKFSTTDTQATGKTLDLSQDSITLSTGKQYAFVFASSTEGLVVGESAIADGATTYKNNFTGGLMVALTSELDSQLGADSIWGMVTKNGTTVADGLPKYAPILTLEGTIVPEPATATLSLLALAGLAARRKRH